MRRLQINGLAVEVEMASFTIERKVEHPDPYVPLESLVLPGFSARLSLSEDAMQYLMPQRRAWLSAGPSLMEAIKLFKPGDEIFLSVGGVTAKWIIKRREWKRERVLLEASS